MIQYDLVDKNGNPLIDYPGKPLDRIDAIVESVYFEKSGDLRVVIKLPNYENPPEQDYPDWV